MRSPEGWTVDGRPPDSGRARMRALTPRSQTPPARLPSSIRGLSPPPTHRSGHPSTTPRSQTPRSQTPTKAETERSKVEGERRLAAQAAKDQRAQREALLQQQQREWCRKAHYAASALRATTTAAVMAQQAELRRQRRSATEEVKVHGDALRRQRDDQRTQWRARGQQLNHMCMATRNAANDARNRVREDNLTEAHRSTAERLHLFRQSAQAQANLNDAKRMMAERVRELTGVEAARKAGLTGGLRRQYRAMEALAVERRNEDTASRQKMHDAVVCARYGVPGDAINSIQLPPGS